MNRMIPAALALVLTLPLSAESLIYRETSQGKTTTETLTVTRIVENGVNWEAAASKDALTRTGTVGGTLVAVEFTSPEGQWSLRSESDVLRASGTAKGKPVAGTLALKGKPWTISFDQPLQWAVNRKLPTLSFLLVNPLEVGKPTEMVLTPDGKDTVNGKPALRYKLSLPGAMAVFWNAVIWADPVTGQQVQYKGNKGPGTPEVVLLIERRS